MASNVLLLLGGAGAMGIGLWALGSGRATARRSSYGRGAMAAAPLQIATGLAAFVAGLVFLFGG